jgi:hypothetical protein
VSISYEGAVEQTFIKSLKSVFLVDDSFPTFEDMFNEGNIFDEFPEADRAKKLYSAFKKQHLPCDIENTFTPGDIDMVERLRKCDLIVIDFHLDGSSNDGAKSIEILRMLSDSPHFNTVIVYTNADLDQVWLDIATNLRPDLRLQPLLDANDQENTWWLEADVEDLLEPSEGALSAYLTRGMDGVASDSRKELIDDIRAHGGAGLGNLRKMAEIRLRAALDERRPAAMKAQDDSDTLGSRTLNGRFEDGKPFWLQCRGCFIAIVKKSDAEDESGVLMNGLKEALLDWKPNFLQILVSEIQNQLELESVATDPNVFSDARRQIGLSHYLMEQLNAEEDPESAIESVVDRLVETIRSRIAAKLPIRDFATDVLKDLQQKLGGKLTTADKLANAAALAHVDGKIDPIGVMSFLNAFVSTETFAKSRITTGTIFSSAGDFWMVAAPACDLTARTPGGSQTWAKMIHPVRPMIAVRLSKTDLSAALQEATRGRHIFVDSESETLSLAVLHPKTSAPDTEMFFAMEAGKVSVADKKATFRAVRVTQAAASPTLTEAAEFTVVGQLRPNYASRILQFTGGHLSRIGIDYFDARGAVE